MPELSRFYGIIIRMYAEVGGQHHTPHFHAYYGDDVAIYSLDPVALIAGYLPTRQRRLVEAWAELHQAELLDAWQRLQHGQKPQAIPPLSQEQHDAPSDLPCRDMFYTRSIHVIDPIQRRNRADDQF